MGYPNGPRELQRWHSNMLRDSISPEVAARHLEVAAQFDSSANLRTVQAPTLVLAGRNDSEIASAVAYLITDARLVILEGDWGTLVGDPGKVLDAIHSFLDEENADSAAVT